MTEKRNKSPQRGPWLGQKQAQCRLHPTAECRAVVLTVCSLATVNQEGLSPELPASSAAAGVRGWGLQTNWGGTQIPPTLHFLLCFEPTAHRLWKDGDIFSQPQVIQDILSLESDVPLQRYLGMQDILRREARSPTLCLATRCLCTLHGGANCRSSSIGPRQGPHRAWEGAPMEPPEWALPPSHCACAIRAVPEWAAIGMPQLHFHLSVPGAGQNLLHRKRHHQP